MVTELSRTRTDQITPEHSQPSNNWASAVWISLSASSEINVYILFSTLYKKRVLMREGALAFYCCENLLLII